MIVAAKYLCVAPWELERQPIVWQMYAGRAAKAEFEAREAARGRS